MKVLITGANGLLATNTIKLFLEKGHTVTGLIRSKEKFLLPSQPGLELFEADILDYPRVQEAVKSCDAVIHIAALTSQDIPDYEAYKDINVHGAENIIKAAIARQVKKFIYVSSANSMGYGSLENPGTENSPAKAPFTKAFYARSKMEAEEKLLSFSEEIEVIRVNPTFMLGPYDGKPSSGQIILMGFNKKMIFYPPGGKNFVDVRDVAGGILKALKNGKNREAYLMANENMSYEKFFELLQLKSQRKSFLMLKVPKIALLAAGYLGDLLRFFRIKTDLSSVNMKILCVSNYYSNQKSKRELGMKYHPVETAVDDAVAWFKNNGILE
ncbi:NAD-dependent epimerase/dehydratase family protein [Zunongwangia sp. F363]|uniref:NAD-dependent epimerase/dehydratase family protein n=1 Tax=Autumnicola tepida TaxID=3075595 RepID=A0ABU3CC99_9FLAO|nr:NAD-dependent epimerase/dehydratase family protein [Zunongwangia sp. F363]MDT0643903.1 NAD-dependent epimerase/dehydratase family protein [Zunongwangia sp. F363]